ncbi:hypothetical protein [Celerinatantimonas sp. YJH-8]|uniref:hypothetical protein n=1 Tax=Celerinatantimonas sp. YJH-8 TaxID=3228714 RepID=UPI0038C4831A
MMNRTTKLIASLAALPMLFSVASYAHQGGGMGMGMRDGMMDGPAGRGQHMTQRCDGPRAMAGYMQQLNLTDAQKAQLYDMQMQRFQHGPRFAGSMHKGKGPQADHYQQYAKQMHDLMMSDKFDEKQVQQLADKMAESHHQFRDQMFEQRMVEHAKWMHQRMSVLTQEQRAKLQDLMSKNQCFNNVTDSE